MNSWWEEAVFYHIYPLGFCDVLDKSGKGSENHFIKIEEALGHISEMGITAMYLGPLFQSVYHGYDTIDYYKIDPRLGSNNDFQSLCRSLKSRGIRIVLDGVFHHVGRDFWAFRDVREKGMDSVYTEWFSGIDFNKSSPMDDPFGYDPWEGHWELVKLNLENREVRNHIFGAVSNWIREYDIDGLRLDVAYLLSADFMKELRESAKKLKEDFFLLGEVIHGDYKNWLGDEALHSVTNYECYKGMFSSHNDRNLYEIAYSLNRLFGPSGLCSGFPLYNFLDNHDVNRIGSTLSKPQWLFTSHLLLFTMPGIPSIYYGSEWAVPGKRDAESDRDLRPPWEQIAKTPKNLDLMNEIKTLSGIRRKSPALKWGTYQNILVDSEVFIFSRLYKEEQLIIMINISEVTRIIEIPNHGAHTFTDILNMGDKFYATAGLVKVEIYPQWGRILSLE